MCNAHNTLEDELAATNNEEHYNKVLAAHGQYLPLRFHCENEQFTQKGNAATSDQKDTSLPNSGNIGNLKLKTANFYHIDGIRTKTLAGTFKVKQ